MRTLKPQVAKASKLRFIESECDLKMKALFITHHWRYSGHLCYCDFNVRMRKYAQCGPRLKPSVLFSALSTDSVE